MYINKLLYIIRCHGRAIYVTIAYEDTYALTLKLVFRSVSYFS